VIPVYNEQESLPELIRRTTAACETLGKAYEILLVDDGSSDATTHWMPQVTGLRYEVRTHNGGFIDACNDGVSRARGRYVVLLNNDTVPQPGWLDALLDTFGSVPDAGLVGSQLLYPDGRLQESGG
ncbi:glycosyltransferase family 2 protein, partial [Klebsiella pneumoniae]|uniref:glycosyltransferase family 2 protein n=1 Tax=Klebsiella pneumoniae TaxID=573 RepID=UPI003F20470A